MNIKKIVKISFILILFIITVIGLINTVIIYQIKENNLAKISINNLVSMQEKMNELLKDTINLDSIDKLDKYKEDFAKFCITLNACKEDKDVKELVLESEKFVWF